LCGLDAHQVCSDPELATAWQVLAAGERHDARWPPVFLGVAVQADALAMAAEPANPLRRAIAVSAMIYALRGGQIARNPVADLSS
jgi:hypothetical protein